MTTFEHVILGMNGAVAAGLSKRHGWKVVALAGVAATAPDWDGLTLLFSRAAFAAGHRLWGHNLLACGLIGLLIGVTDYRWDLCARCGRRVVQWTRLTVASNQLAVRQQFSGAGLTFWGLVGATAALSHLPADAVVSGTASLPDWELRPLWPFADSGVVFPLVPWGDPGITVVFCVGLFALVRWRHHAQYVAAMTLASVTAYLLIRGFVTV